jgi:N-glycosylase/DNA lyase
MLIKSPINLDLTQMSGQTSQSPWALKNNIYQGLVFIEDKPILIKVNQDLDYLNYDYELPLDSSFKIRDSQVSKKISEIFDLNFNLDNFYKFLKEDENLRDVSDFSNGLRLFIAKDLFECVISSICSANNSIIRWTKSINSIKENWGNSYEFPSGIFHSFPNENIIKNSFLDENEEFASSKNLGNIDKCNNNLKSFGVGYRASYMKKASEIFTLEMHLQDIQKMNYDEAFETIIKVPGVGPKVDDCILLYGYYFKEAFPTDVWIKRIISYLYFNNKDISPEKIREFSMDKFGEYGGYVQLYLFHYARKSGLMEKLKKKK